MDFDSYSTLDYVFVLIPVQLILVTCLTIYHKLKVRWPLKVNCWFCNNNTKIWRRDLDWWLCPSCEQYNGFSKNGDYAYDIPEQYAVSSKCMKYCRLPKQNDTANVTKRNLCTDCNQRESLKLLQLSNFEPKNETLYNIELKAFKEHLEIKYPLCDKCKSMVRDVLNKQTLWLTRYKMLFFKQKSVEIIINKARKSEKIFRLICLVLDAFIACNHDFTWLPISGLFFHLFACWASSMKKKRSDTLLILLWCCTIVLVLVKNLISLQNIWFVEKYIVRYHMIPLCVFFIGFVSINSSQWYIHKNTLSGSVALKKLNLHAQDAIIPKSTYTNGSENVILNDKNNSSISSDKIGSELSLSEIKTNSTISKQKSSAFTIDRNIANIKGNNSYSNSVSPNNNNSLSDYYNLNDSMNVLSALSLSCDDSPKYDGRKAPSIFQRKIYSVTDCDLFRRTGVRPGKRCVLSPPKLRSVMQTSWVAGGYWQESMMGAPTLSRSSSQSSGFGSVGSSNFAPSREPSVHEFDRCSVVSDVTQSCYTPRSSYLARDSTKLVCRTPMSHAPRTHSQCSTHDAIPTSPTATRNCSQSPLTSSVRAYGVTIAENHRTAQEHVRNRNDSMPSVCPNHTTIVTMSPSWLSALLCGSLILNMIVLCAMLLR